jgi:chromosome segregation ATPase
MTKLGKIFTTIMMLLSVMFFLAALLANMSYVDYGPILNAPEVGLKAVAQKQQARVTALNDQIQKLKQTIEVELASRSAALAALQMQLDVMDNEVRGLEKTLDTRQGEVLTLAQTEQSTKDDLIAASQENDKTKALLAQTRADRNKVFNDFKNAYAELLKLQGDHRTLQTQYNELNKPASASDASPSDGAR